jgi:predicted membrane protein
VNDSTRQLTVLALFGAVFGALLASAAAFAFWL